MSNPSVRHTSSNAWPDRVSPKAVPAEARRRIMGILNLPLAHELVRLRRECLGFFFNAAGIPAGMRSLEDAGNDSDQDDEGGECIGIDVGSLI